ncbi:MAG: Bcr/CflA family multidrug efflux MFS transporter [Alphaproteobacteria bacterium]
MSALSPPSPLPKYRERVLIVVLSALTAIAPLATDMYLPALPTVALQLKALPGSAQLTLSTFFLGFGMGQLIYGPLADRLGRRPPLIAGLVLFTLASAGCALAESLDALLLWRFVQALGGCGGPVIARAIVRDLYGRDQAARVLSLMVLVMGIAPMIAPLLGGQVLLVAGWRVIFWLLAGFGVLAIGATLSLLHETLPHAKRARGGLLTLARGYGAPLTHGRFLGYAASGALVYGGLFAYLSGSPLVLIMLYGVPPERFGLIFGMNVLGMLLAAAVNSRLVVRFGTDRMLGFGLLGAAISGALLAVVAGLAWGGLTLLLVPLFFFLASLGFSGPNAIAGCLNLFPTRAGTASALFGTMQFLAGAIASALLGVMSSASALPMAGVIAVAGLAALIIQRTLARA